VRVAGYEFAQPRAWVPPSPESPAPTPEPGPPPAVTPDAPVVRIARVSARPIVRRGRIRVRLACRGNPGQTCTGTLKLTKRLRKRTRPGHFTINLGRARYTIRAGKGRTVTVRLTRAAARRYARAPKHRLGARATARDSQRPHAPVARILTLRPPPRR
jgi:hypothetical protein